MIENARSLAYEATPEGQNEEHYRMLDLAFFFSKSIQQSGCLDCVLYTDAVWFGLDIGTVVRF